MFTSFLQCNMYSQIDAVRAPVYSLRKVKLSDKTAMGRSLKGIPEVISECTKKLRLLLRVFFYWIKSNSSVLKLSFDILLMWIKRNNNECK